MKTTCSAEEIEDELNELKLRIAKMNARRNAQINLLQKNIEDESWRNKIYSKPNDVFKSNYLRYPLNYYWPFLPPYKYSSWSNLQDTLNIDDSPKKYPHFLSKRDQLEAYKLLEQKVQSDVLRKLKRFALDREKDITGEFLDKLIFQRKPYTPDLRFEKKFDDKKHLDVGLKLNSDDRQSPFLKPINKSDNFYKRYNSFMKRILKPLRKISPPLTSDNNKFDRISTKRTNWDYKKPSSCTSNYFPPKINKPTSPIKSPLNNLNVSYLRPWQKYSPIHRDYFADYEYPPKSYRVPRDVDTIIRDMEFENRRTYPFMSTYYPSHGSSYNYYPPNTMKYDPYESDSYVRSTLPTWKQYYYTQKLRSKPSHEKFIDYYDPYRDFFYDGASIKSVDLNTSPNKEEFETSSLQSDNCSVLQFDRSCESLNDLQIIDDYRDSIYEEIINNLKKQQRQKFKKNNRFSSRSFTPGVLKNDRSLYNYRIAEPTLNRSYSWRQPPSYDSTYKKYNFKNSSVLSKDDKWKSSNYENLTTPITENKISPLSSATKNELNSQESVDNQEDKPSLYTKYTNNVSSSGCNQLDSKLPSAEFSSSQKYDDNAFSTAHSTTDEGKYQGVTINNPSLMRNASTYNFTPLDKEKRSIGGTSYPATSHVTNVESPVRENVDSHVIEKDTEPVNSIRRGSIYDSRQFSDPSSPIKQIVSSPHRQSLQSDPQSSLTQLPESSSTVPTSLSRKNSMQHPIRKGSIQTSSIEEEPGKFPNMDKNRRYSKDQFSYPPETAFKNITPGGTTADSKRLSYGGSIKEPINEAKEEKIKPEAEYNSYSQYKEIANLPQQRNYPEDKPNRSHQFQSQNFENTATSSGPDTNTNSNYQEKPYHETSEHQSNYNRYPETSNASNYNERYYNNQYDPRMENQYPSYEYSYPDHKNEYNDQYNYPTRYDDDVAFDGKVSGRVDSSYVEPRPQHKDSNFTTEKRPSNESYQAADRPRATEYEKYPNEEYKPDYYRNNRSAENRASMHQSDSYDGNKYRESSQDENYGNTYLYQDPQLSRPHRDDFRTGAQEGHVINDNQYAETEPKSYENYSLNSTAEKDANESSYPYSGQNSYENTNYPSGENFNEPALDNIQDTPPEIIKSASSEQKVKVRKKSSVIESSQDSEAPVTEPPSKDVSISRRTSKAALTLAEQRKAAALLADKNKTMKAKLSESKLKRTPSVLKTKSVKKP